MKGPDRLVCPWSSHEPSERTLCPGFCIEDEAGDGPRAMRWDGPLYLVCRLGIRGPLPRDVAEAMLA